MASEDGYQNIELISQVKEKAVDKLQDLIPLVRETELDLVDSWEFNSNEFKQAPESITENLQSIVKFLKGYEGLCIYRYTLLSEGEDKKLFRRFVKYKAKQKILKKGPQRGKFYNVSRPNINQGPYLYVGSKIKNHDTRFRQHLGIMGRTVYSMYMANWIPKDIEIRFELFAVRSENREVLVQLEQALWDISKPMLGKQSSH